MILLASLHGLRERLLWPRRVPGTAVSQRAR